MEKPAASHPYVLEIEKQARTVDVEAEFTRPENYARLLGGYSADLEIILATRPDVLRISTEALMEDNRILIYSTDDNRVLGSTLRSELFGTGNPLNEHIRVGGERYRIIGVMESKGQVPGMDLDDTIYIPAARALSLFNRDSLMEIDLLYEEGADLALVIGIIAGVIPARRAAQSDPLEALRTGSKRVIQQQG